MTRRPRTAHRPADRERSRAGSGDPDVHLDGVRLALLTCAFVGLLLFLCVLLVLSMMGVAAAHNAERSKSLVASVSAPHRSIHSRAPAQGAPVRNQRPPRPPLVAPDPGALIDNEEGLDITARPGVAHQGSLSARSKGAGAAGSHGTARAVAALPPSKSGAGAPGSSTTTRTLVLYDTTGAFGWMGELYAMNAANLASHFGSWTAMPVASYKAGMVDQYTASIYIGSTYDEPLPTAFLDDVHGTTKPVIWMYDNIWSLSNRHTDFQAKYGFMWWKFDTASVSTVTYKGVNLTRSLDNKGGIMQHSTLDPAKAKVLATAKRADGTTLPWAVRSGNLTYIGELPFTYTAETDRDLIFDDLLFDALKPAAPTRHRAMIRLEDLNPMSDPAQLRAAADVLSARRVPFGFGVSPQYLDPKLANGTVASRALRAAPDVIAAIKYLQARGGVMIEHGYTHQYSNVANPYNATSGDDFEFYRTFENPDHTLNFAGPLPGDSEAWAAGRINAANAEFRASGLAVPTIFEFPHYTGSVPAYRAAAAAFAVRWERAMYFSGQLRGGAINYGRPVGQRFPFAVRDMYGSTVLPENIGSYEPTPFFQFPVHSVADIVHGADSNMVVRDGFASFYFHPFWGAAPLAQTLDALKAKGWTFVSPTDVARGG